MRGFSAKKITHRVRLALRWQWLALLLLIFPTPGSADIYMFIDSDGVLHFTNTPTNSNYKLYIKERPRINPRAKSSRSYDPIISQAAERFGVAFPLIKALIKVESNFDPQAVSHRGAMGLMQIMPENLSDFKVRDPFNPLDNIMGGAGYISRLINRYEGQLPLAIAAYNAGPTIVDRYRRIPPIKETEDFVRRVMKYYYLYKNS